MESAIVGNWAMVNEDTWKCTKGHVSYLVPCPMPGCGAGIRLLPGLSNPFVNPFRKFFNEQGLTDDDGETMEAMLDPTAEWIPYRDPAANVATKVDLPPVQCAGCGKEVPWHITEGGRCDQCRQESRVNMAIGKLMLMAFMVLIVVWMVWV